MDVPKKHAILSPSAADRWIACPPSARFEEQIPEAESPYATEGTLAHELAALILGSRSGVSTDPQPTFNKKLQTLQAQIDGYYLKAGEPSAYSAMLDHCEDYAAYVTDLNGEVLIEHSYNLEKYIPLGFGTADATVIAGTHMHVIDFKYGAGVRVSATGNKQMMCYALGALEEAKARKKAVAGVTLHIYQPRVGGVSSWGISVASLLEWAEIELTPKATLAIAGAGNFTPGDHCRFCKARTRCKAYYDRFAEVRGIMDKRELTSQDLATVLTFGPSVASWVEKMQEDCIAKLQRGEPVEGFKLVNGRGRRSFKNEDLVVETLLAEGYESDTIFDSKLRSLSALEKAMGAKRFKLLFEGQIINVPGSPKLAPIDDERPAASTSGTDEYD